MSLGNMCDHRRTDERYFSTKTGRQVVVGNASFQRNLVKCLHLHEHPNRPHLGHLEQFQRSWYRRTGGGFKANVG